MHLSRHSMVAIGIIGVLAGPMPGAAQEQPASLWTLNNSVVGLYILGNRRILRYEQPRIALEHEGVRPGTVLFKGMRSDTGYSGTAYVFTRHCKAYPFEVLGTVADGGRHIVLKGVQPTALNAQCEPVDFKVEEFRITFLGATAPPLVTGSLEREPPDVDESKARAQARLAAIRAEKAGREQRQRQEVAERVRRHREQENQRLADLREFSSQSDACRAFDLSACRAALGSFHASPEDAVKLQNWRDVALKFRADMDRCRTGSISACDDALTSPAVTEGQRHPLEQWRMAASPFNRTVAFIAGYAGMIADAGLGIAGAIASLPISIRVGGGVMATILALALGMVLRTRRADSQSEPRAEIIPPPGPDMVATRGRMPNDRSLSSGLSAASPDAPYMLGLLHASKLIRAQAMTDVERASRLIAIARNALARNASQSRRRAHRQATDTVSSYTR
ncbi:MAG: hypothetical protein AB7O44_29040 [Hyphomicrobiaceae bacterium]